MENSEAAFGARRAEMVKEQLVARGIKDPRVLGAIAEVPRHAFVAPALAELAYADRPLPIGAGGQTISQPFMVARATELAEPRPGDRALEVGAGSGYQLAVLARLCAHAYGIELNRELCDRARETLRGLGVGNVTLECFDGSGGWAEHAPYDVIIVSAGAPRIPPMLAAQLADGGRMVIPVGPHDDQELLLVTRTGDTYNTVTDTRCRYIDLRGRWGHGQTPPTA